jgi:hypothetical protein
MPWGKNIDMNYALPKTETMMHVRLANEKIGIDA